MKKSLVKIYVPLVSIFSLLSYGAWDRIPHRGPYIAMVIVVLIIPLPAIVCWRWIDRFINHRVGAVYNRLTHCSEHAEAHEADAQRGQWIVLSAFLGVIALGTCAVVLARCMR